MSEEESRLREGIPVREEHWDQVVAIAGEVGIDLEALRGHSEEEES